MAGGRADRAAAGHRAGAGPVHRTPRLHRLCPRPGRRPAAAGVAQVNLHFDGDRVIRKAYLEEGGDGRSWLQLGAMMAGYKTEANAVSGRLGLWQERPVLIPYGGSAGHVRTISFIDLLK